MTSPQSYILVESRYFLHGHPRICYGIALIEEDEADVAILQTVCDISPDRERVADLVELCNRLHPSEEWFAELVEEFLG